MASMLSLHRLHAADMVSAIKLLEDVSTDASPLAVSGAHAPQQKACRSEHSKAEGLAFQAALLPAPGAKGTVQDGSPTCGGAALMVAAPCSRGCGAVAVQGGMAAGAALMVAPWGSVLTLQVGIEKKRLVH